MRLLTQDKDFFPREVSGKLLQARELGFDGFEIDGRLLLDRFEEVRQASAGTGMPIVTACGGYGGWIGDFNEERRQQGLRDIAAIMARLGALGGTGIVVPAAWGMFSLRLPPMSPPRSPEEDRRVLLDSLTLLEAEAVRQGVTVYLEPLNRYEDHMLNTLAAARSLIAAGGFAAVRLTADFYHMNIEEARIPESLTAQQTAVGHVHLADSHRFQPGTGHMDFTEGFRALKASGYTGAMAFECRVLGEDPLGAYRDSVVHIRHCLAEAGW